MAEDGYFFSMCQNTGDRAFSQHDRANRFVWEKAAAESKTPTFTKVLIAGGAPLQ